MTAPGNNFFSISADFIEISDNSGKGLGTEIAFGAPVKVSQFSFKVNSINHVGYQSSSFFTRIYVKTMNFENILKNISKISLK